LACKQELTIVDKLGTFGRGTDAAAHSHHSLGLESLAGNAGSQRKQGIDPLVKLR